MPTANSYIKMTETIKAGKQTGEMKVRSSCDFPGFKNPRVDSKPRVNTSGLSCSAVLR
jgi:hypothetical protein